MGYEIVILSMELINQNHCKWSMNPYTDHCKWSMNPYTDSKQGTCENLIKIQLEIIITFGRSTILSAQKKWVTMSLKLVFLKKSVLITRLNNDIKFGNYKDSLA